MMDIDEIVWQAESDYRNGIKNKFVSGWLDDEPEDDDEADDEADDIEVEYIDANGRKWYVYLTATEKAQLDAIPTYEGRLEYLEKIC